MRCCCSALAACADCITAPESYGGSGLDLMTSSSIVHLSPFVQISDQVKSTLVAHGFTLASSIPTVNKSFVLMQSSSVTKAQAAYDFLDQIGLWLPLLSLVALWAYAATSTIGGALAQRAYDRENNTTGGPDTVLLHQLIAERTLTYVWLSSGHGASRAAVDKQRPLTDAAVTALRSGGRAADSELEQPGRLAPGFVTETVPFALRIAG